MIGTSWITPKQSLKNFDLQNRYIFLLFVVVSFISCSQYSSDAWIKGKIIDPSAKTIRIGDTSVSLSDDGEFSLILKPESPEFYLVNYSNTYWMIYIEPGKKIELKLKGSDLSSLEYEGDLRSSNYYLKQTITTNNGTNNYLNTNWINIHNLNESGFISVIDSLKGLFLNPLSRPTGQYKDLSKDFIKLFTADVDFGFNQLIIQYPENHLMYTGEKTALSQPAYDYLKSVPFDNREMFKLENYNGFCKSWIHYNAGLAADKDSEQKHYNLKEMDAVFNLLPDIFHEKYLSDYWLSECLYEFISMNGLTNSRRYIEDFKSVCTTKEFITRITELVENEERKREDHLVKVYKTINGFSLEAHIFSPDNLGKNEKRPAIVLFHGGGWQGGNPSWMFGIARHYKDLGLVAIAAQYRLGNRKDIFVYECLDDARDVIKWIRANSDSLNITSDRIAAYGWSAGGHLSISSAIFNDLSSVTGFDSSPNTVILFSPAVSLPTNISWKVSALGYGTDRKSINPVDHVRKGLPPTIILQGRDDTVTPLAEAQLFTDKMNEYGNYCELIIYDNVGHLFTPNTIPDYNDPQPDPDILKNATQKADEFLIKLKYVKK